MTRLERHLADRDRLILFLKTASLREAYWALRSRLEEGQRDFPYYPEWTAHRKALNTLRSLRRVRETVGSNLEWLGMGSLPSSPEHTFTGSYDSQGLPIHI